MTDPNKHSASDGETLLLKDLLEQDLTDQVSKWAYRVLFYLVGSASLCLYLIGEQNYINPLLVSLVTFFAGHYKLKQQAQWIIRLVVLTVLIVRHALSQGCSASLVPCIYGFIPCVCAFLFRTKKVVVLSTVLVLVATLTIFAVDLSNHCTTTPIQPHQTFYIIADRLLPLLVLVCGNSLIIIAIVQQSQKAIAMHSEAAEQSQQLALIRRDVLHRVTHELRTPLVGLVGGVDLLVHSSTLSDYDMDNALTIKTCLNNILRICDDVLMAAKQNNNDERTSSSESLFVVASLIDDVCDVFTNNSKHIVLQVEYDGSHIYNVVRGKEVELRQVLLNLVGNAMKFTDEHGRIIIRVQQPKESSSYTFKVQDTGIGIAKSTPPESLFEPFQQGTPAISRHYKGTGLGLTICKEFVERMGGTISVESEGIGRGSCFFFTIALKQDEQESVECRAFTRNCRVVIADSEPSEVSCRSIVKSIQPSAHITTVDSPSELMDMVQQDKDGSDDEHICVAFVSCDEMDTETLKSTIGRLNAAGWLVFAYCCRDSFAHLLSNSKGLAYATFRRPLPLIRVGDAFRGALSGRDGGQVGRNVVDGNIGGSIGCFNKKVKPPPEKEGLIELPAGSKIVVVDDTPVNVKVLVRMLSRSTSAPVISCLDGQSAIILVETSQKEDTLLFLMDWHMPGLCGLTATESIQTTVRKQGGPKVFICMVTADAEGLREEMLRRHMSLEGTIRKGQFVAASSVSPGESSEESAATSRCHLGDASPVIDILVEKPIPFSSIPTILRWFQGKLSDAD